MRICKYCGTVSLNNASVCGACGGADFSNKCDNCATEYSDGNFCPKCGVKEGTKPKRCPECGTDYFSNACPNCGFVSGRSPQKIIPLNPGNNYNGQNVRSMPQANGENYILDLILCIFFGYLGVHKFIRGKVGLGLLYLFTFGFGGIGWFIDICILTAKCAKSSAGAGQVNTRMMDNAPKTNTHISLVLGILGMCMSCCYGIPGIVLGGLGIYFSTYGTGRNRGISNVGGFVCSVISMVVGLFLFVAMMIAR